MAIRRTGHQHVTSVHGEDVRAFVPLPLPPREPPLQMDNALRVLLSRAREAIGRLSVAATLVPSTDWFLYGFVRKEAVLTSQIEGTQATLRDVLTYEATDEADRPEDVEEVCNYVEALNDARQQMSAPDGLPLSTRLLRDAHRVLMRGVRGQEKQPGEVRRSQNWIGGSRPGTARFVPPPPGEVPAALAALERWWHADETLPPLIRAGLAHAQFETIHPFLDGNGRIGRLLIALLLEHWGVLEHPVLYISVAFRRRQREYYDRLAAIRSQGDWEGWTRYFLACVAEAAEDGVRVAMSLHALLLSGRARVLVDDRATVPSIQLFDRLPRTPVVTAQSVEQALSVSPPTARKAIEALESLRVLHETTGRQRNRVYLYADYLNTLTGDAP